MSQHWLCAATTHKRTSAVGSATEKQLRSWMVWKAYVSLSVDAYEGLLRRKVVGPMLQQHYQSSVDGIVRRKIEEAEALGRSVP